jgi:hypothetical protein
MTLKPQDIRRHRSKAEPAFAGMTFQEDAAEGPGYSAAPKKCGNRVAEMAD